MGRTIVKYFRVWKRLTSLSAGSYLSNRIDSLSYLAGKLVRFGFFLLLILALFRHTGTVAGYTKYEVILFYLTFNLIDVLAQALFRGIYLFRFDILRGNFDFVLSKPVNALFYSLSRLTDLLDTIFLVPIVALIAYAMAHLPAPPSLSGVLLYAAFVGMGMLIVLGIHILSASITIWKRESENFIWLYRDAMTVGRFPPEIYAPAVQLLFIFVIPIITIIGFPVKVLLHALSGTWMLFMLIYTVLFFWCSLALWRKALRSYSSASS